MTKKITPEKVAGKKFDKGKQQWYPMPLTVLKDLADAFVAGEPKYGLFNCLEPFEDSDRRFWDAAIRHLEECQINPLAKDPDGTGCYSAAQVAFSILMRLYNAKQREIN
jgi:hypothetical protein